MKQISRKRKQIYLSSNETETEMKRKQMSPPSPSSSTSKNAANSTPSRDTEEKYAGGCRRSHKLALTADLLGGKWKVKRARGRRTERRSHPHFIVAMIRRRVSIPARRKGRAGVFPFPREAARATRRRP
jgi:hypothetical protein